jgi:hypothetical protein
LESVDITQEATKICSPVTARFFNIISNDMLSMPGGITGLFNYFDYEPGTLKFDQKKMQADIIKYGLLTYEDYKNLLPYEIYRLLPCEYMSISIGKGLVTWERICGYVKHWGNQLAENI